MLRTGAPWRDLPERFGPWSTAWNRFRRWTAAGVWERVLKELQRDAEAGGRLDWETHFVDGSVVRAHQHAAGAVGRQENEALGRTRGGFSTKVHPRAEGGEKGNRGHDPPEGREEDACSPAHQLAPAETVDQGRHRNLYRLSALHVSALA